jgi:undecaprenyl-diphosphatase
MPAFSPSPVSTSGPVSGEKDARRAGRWSWLSTAWGLALLFLVTVLGPLFLFFRMASRIWNERSFPWDASLLQTIHAHATPACDAMMVFITHRGGGWEVGIVAGTLVAALAARRRFNDAAFLAVAMSGVGFANDLAKITFQRVRPHFWESAAPEFDYGFPSGHSMSSFGLALAVAILAWRTRWRWTVVAAGAGFILAVGLSRVYLGVHYPSDVLGAWLLTWAWVAAAAFVRSGQAVTRLLATPWRECAAYGLMLALLPAAYVGRVLSEDNFHIVSPAQVYRSGQMDSDSLRRVIQRYRIQSVVNLRGANPQDEWYRNETNTARKLGVRYLDFSLSAGCDVSDEEIEAIMEFLRSAPKPVLVHCYGGADRTGLISGLYLYTVEGKPLAQASQELSPFYGHIPHLYWRYSIAMDRSFWRYVSNHLADGAMNKRPAR